MFLLSQIEVAKSICSNRILRNSTPDPLRQNEQFSVVSAMIESHLLRKRSRNGKTCSSKNVLFYCDVQAASQHPHHACISGLFRLFGWLVDALNRLEICRKFVVWRIPKSRKIHSKKKDTNEQNLAIHDFQTTPTWGRPQPLQGWF